MVVITKRCKLPHQVSERDVGGTRKVEAVADGTNTTQMMNKSLGRQLLYKKKKSCTLTLLI